jgi:hypothetical protein
MHAQDFVILIWLHDSAKKEEGSGAGPYVSNTSKQADLEPCLEFWIYLFDFSGPDFDPVQQGPDPPTLTSYLVDMWSESTRQVRLKLVHLRSWKTGPSFIVAWMAALHPVYSGLTHITVTLTCPTQVLETTAHDCLTWHLVHHPIIEQNVSQVLSKHCDHEFWPRSGTGSLFPP